MTTSEKSFTRRHVVGSASLGLAASIAPAMAQGSKSISGGEFPGFVDKYPKPPFKKQSQPWPGLASKMEPPPDHGETSYKRLRPARRAQGADHRRRFRHGPRGGDRLCARRRRRRDQLFPDRGAGRAGGHRADQGRRAARRLAIPGDLRDEAFCQRAGRGGGRRARRPRHRRQQRRRGSRRAHRSSTSRPRISTRR